MAGGTADTYELDAIDRRIIKELVADSRISMRALAEKAHISRAHAYVRIERLQEAGIIEGFTTRISHSKAGLGSSAFIALSIRQDSWRGISTQLRTLPFVEHFSLLGGDFDVLVWCAHRTTAHCVMSSSNGCRASRGCSRPRRG